MAPFATAALGESIIRCMHAFSSFVQLHTNAAAHSGVVRMLLALTFDRVPPSNARFNRELRRTHKGAGRYASRPAQQSVSSHDIAFRCAGNLPVSE